MLLRSASACANSSEMATFIRVPQALVMGIPTIVSTAEMIACAEFCRNNTEPLSGLHRPCKGFNFQSNVIPTCEFFDDQSKVGVLNRNVGERSYFFDKICLPEGGQCGDRSFAFDVIANARLNGEVYREVWTHSRSECLSTCLNETEFTCQAVNYDTKRKRCELYNASRRSVEANFTKDVQDVDYYENNCLDKEARCPSGQIGFVKLAHTGIRGFDVNAGVKLLADCLLDCLKSKVLFCRSVEYDSDSNECYISEEDTNTSEKHVVTDSAVSVDLYEPFCLPGITESKCSQSYVYEKLRSTYMQAAHSLTTMVNVKLENCLLACMNHEQCRALNFDKMTGNCELLPFGRASQTVSLKAVASIDFYELTCSRESEESLFFTSGRLPRKSSVSPFFLQSNDEPGIDPASTFVPHWTPDSVTTSTVAFTPTIPPADVDLLAAAVNKKRPLASLTESDMISTKGQVTPLEALSPSSLENTTAQLDLTTSATPVYGICGFRFQAQDRRIKLDFRTDRTNIPDLKQCQRLCEITTEFRCVSVSYSVIHLICGLSDYNLDDYTLEELTEDENGSNFYGRELCLLQNGASDEENALPQKGDEVTLASPPITSAPPTPIVTLKRESTGTARAPVPPSAAPVARISSNATTRLPQPPSARPEAQSPGIRPPSTTRSLQRSTSPSPPQLFRPNSPAPKLTASSSAQQRSVPRQLSVENKVSPSDIIVEANCLQEGVNITISIERGDDLMTGVIVISNDRVLPHDVTTKEDLFYQISCNYSLPPLPIERRFFFRAGVVVGGPEPRLVSADELERPARDLDVRMRILRNGNAVDNVLIGEQLTLSIESSEPAKNMKIIDCNVTRIGGGTPAPSPLRLVEEGCAAMSQIMGPIKLGSKGMITFNPVNDCLHNTIVSGLEATLTAFRIDGSAEIEIDCEVMFCREGCVAADCEGDNNSIETTKARRRRATVLSTAGEMVETVDGRLRVFMEGEKGAPNWKELQYDSKTYGRRCMSETVFMASVACLSAILLIVIIAIGCAFHRKSLVAQLIRASAKSVGSTVRSTHNESISNNRRRLSKRVSSFRDVFVFSKTRSGLGVEDTLDRPYISKSAIAASQM
uniref:PAN domain protein n=1 Tax=Plectus sambesii TaxID=2011161 RepID=A0A914WPT3_9BILA